MAGTSPFIAGREPCTDRHLDERSVPRNITCGAKMEFKDKYARSAGCYEDAKEYLSGGVNSNFRLGMKPFPLFYNHAVGSRLFGVDGNEYVDYLLGMGR